MVTPRDGLAAVRKATLPLMVTGRGTAASSAILSAMQGSGSKYSTKRGALKASSRDKIALLPMRTCCFLMGVGTGTTKAKSFKSP